jgi:prolyl-tRNA synthetase
MGGYGMGMERVLYAVVAQHLSRGMMRWPAKLRPLDALVAAKDSASVHDAEALYQKLRDEGSRIALDDRASSWHEKQRTAVQLGIPLLLQVDHGRVCARIGDEHVLDADRDDIGGVLAVIERTVTGCSTLGE